MSDSEEYQKWLADYIDSPGSGMTLLRAREGGALFVCKKLDAELKPLLERVQTLRCANLPVILDVSPCDEPGALNVTQEYIRGETLRSVIERDGPLDDGELAALALDMCNACGALHGLEPPVIHRDIKPENIIKADTGRYVLIDFDAARFFDASAAHDTQQLGTHGYAAPEQYGFAQTNMRSDIYALGATLYEARTGKPFETGARCPGTLGAVVDKCTRFDYARRYANVRALTAAIKRAERSKRRRRIVFAALGIAAAACALALTLIFSNRGEPSGENEPGVSVVNAASVDNAASADNAAAASGSAAIPGADASGVPCTCSLTNHGDLFESGVVISPYRTVFHFHPGETLDIPVSVFWLRDDTNCKALVHDEPKIALMLDQFVPRDDNASETAGSTIDENTFSREDGVLHVREAGSYGFTARGEYHGEGYGFRMYVDVVEESNDSALTFCICELVTDPLDPQLHGVPLPLHPRFTFAPLQDEITTLPYTAPLTLVFPTTDDDCIALEHTAQAWTFTLDEATGAYIEGDSLTISEPGVYHINYAGVYNGRRYEGKFEITAPSR